MKALSLLLMALGAVTVVAAVTFAALVALECLADRKDPEPEIDCPDEIEPPDLLLACEEMWARPSSFFDQADGEMRSW